MKKKVNYKSMLITIGIILAIVIIAYLSLQKSAPVLTDTELVQCIGEKSTLFVQLGCTHCEDQEELFGDNLKYINKIDCFYEADKCAGIESTPTWKIGNKKYVGVKTIGELKELTKC